MGDPEIRALLVRRGFQRNHAENGRAVQPRTDGEQREDNQNFRQPGGERQPGQAGGENQHADKNQFRFAEFFHEFADDALHQRGDDAGVGEQIADAVVEIFPAKTKLVLGQQRKGGFKTGEAKRRQKKDADEQAELGLGEHVRPLIHFGAGRDGRGIRLAALAEDEPAENEIPGAETRGHPAGRLFAVKDFDGKRADGRAENKSQAKRHANQTHARGAFFRRRNVGDVGRGNGQIRAADAGENPRQQNPHQPGRAAHATGDGEQRVGAGGTEVADEHDRTAADAVGQTPPDGREEKLHGGKRGDDAADDETLGGEVGAEIVLGVAGQQRQHDAEADQVNEDRQKNHEDGRLAIHVQKSSVSLALKTGESNLLAA